MRRARDIVRDQTNQAECARQREHDVLRRRFFAEAHETASRHGIGVEQVIEHLCGLSSETTLHGARHLGDLTLVVACLEDGPEAWLDLTLQHERALTRRLASLIGEHDALVLTRRWMVELQRRTRASLPGGLQDYTGDHSLRHWLGRHLVGHVRLDRIGTDQSGSSIRHWTVRSPLPTGDVKYTVPVSNLSSPTTGPRPVEATDDRILAFPR